MLETTRSEQARHARAQLKVIAASLELGQLQTLLELGRGLLDQADQREQRSRHARQQ